MVTKKIPAKKSTEGEAVIREKVTRLTATPLPKSHIKTPHKHFFSRPALVLVTVLGMLLLEGIFSIPSKWLHGESRDLPPRSVVEKDICTAQYTPVCGKDGKTYANRCMLEAANEVESYNGECKTDEDAVITITPPADPTLLTGSADQTVTDLTEPAPLPIPQSYQTYTNTPFGYELGLPKYAYYRGSLSSDRKSHTLSVDTTSRGTENPTTTLVRVTYSPTGITPPTDAKVSRMLSGGVLTVNYTEPLSAKGQEIVDAIAGTAKSIR